MEEKNTLNAFEFYRFFFWLFSFVHNQIYFDSGIGGMHCAVEDCKEFVMKKIGKQLKVIQSFDINHQANKVYQVKRKKFKH